MTLFRLHAWRNDALFLRLLDNIVHVYDIVDVYDIVHVYYIVHVYDIVNAYDCFRNQIVEM